MKYSLTFLYSLLLKNGYKVINITQKKDVYEVTIEHPIGGNQWVIKLEPDPEDSVRNVLCQIKSVGNVTIGMTEYGPILIR